MLLCPVMDPCLTDCLKVLEENWQMLLEQMDMRARGGRDRDYTADADVKMLQGLSESAAAIVAESEAALASLAAMPPLVGTTPRQFATLRQLRHLWRQGSWHSPWGVPSRVE